MHCGRTLYGDAQEPAPLDAWSGRLYPTVAASKAGSAGVSKVRIVTQRLIGVLAVAAAIVVATHRMASGSSGFATYQPVTVDPLIDRPHTKRCSVTIVREQAFANFDPVFAKYAPPAACPGPWNKVVLDFDTHVKGVQYDRIGMLWLGRDEILRFSTAEPTRRGISYHIEKDVTQYIPLLRWPRRVTALLGNLVNKEYTGIFYVTATLTFYESAGVAAPPASVADVILPVDGAKKDQPSDDSGHLTKTLLHLPPNIERATLDLYVTNHGCDEFWYSNQPDAYAAAHKKDQLCGGNAYREIDVSIDGKLASVVYPFPYIWTGGVNPLLWRPLSAIHTLDVPAYEVDLNPWAGLLSDGKPHAIGLSVLDDRGSWPMDANLLLWTDPHRAHTGGAVVVDSIAAGVPTSVSEKTTARGGRFWLAASRDWRVSGYVDTSAGRVWLTVESHMRFRNLQFLDLLTGEGNAMQETSFKTTTTVRDASGSHVSTTSTSYPLVVNATYPPPEKSKPYSLVIEAEVHQGLHLAVADGRCDESVDATATLKRIKPHVDDVARGRTIESNSCRGSYGTFTIHKSAIDGRDQPGAVGFSRP
jgi:hypothetical protein